MRAPFADLPVRYRTMPAGDLVEDAQVHRTSLIASAVTVALVGGFLWLAFSEEKRSRPARLRAIREGNEALARRRNPRRRK